MVVQRAEAISEDRVHRAVGEAVCRIIAMAAASDPDAEATLERTAEVMVAEGARLVDGAECVVSVVAPERPSMFRVVAGYGAWAAKLVGREWPLNEELHHGRAMLGNKIIETANAPAESATPEVFAGGAIRVGRLVPLGGGHPLPDGRVTMGVIGFWRAGFEPYTGEEREIIDTFGRLAAIAMMRADARVATDRLAERMRLAAHVSAELASTLEYAEVARIVVARALEVGSADRVTLMSLDDEVVRVIDGYDVDGRVAPTGIAFPLTPHLNEALKRSQPTVETRPALQGVPRTLREQLRGVKQRATLPLRVGGQTVAILAVSRRSDRLFSEIDLENLVEIGGRAALALQNSRMYTLETQRLREHAERMRELEKVKSEFLRLASHELRSPLGVIRGYVSMIEANDLNPDDLGRAIPVIQAKIKQMSSLIEEMIETARLEEDQTQLRFATCDLRKLVEASVDSIRPSLTPLHRLTVSLPQTAVMVEVDPARIDTIVVNLLDNAIKFSPEGGRVRCEVFTTRESARVRVADHGLGIAAEDLPRMFSRFGRVVTLENSHIPGTGLGLYLSRELARKHNGDIHLRTRPGHGATFTLSLPLLPRPGRG
ncbi:MAG: ATP-binding protein [Candidatus Dormibacteria bacterium]